MEKKDFIIIICILLICINLNATRIINNEKFINTKGPDQRCFGLSSIVGMSRGDLKVNGVYCEPDPNDCFIENKTSRCYCKILS